VTKKVLSAKQRAGGALHLDIHLDITKVQADGTPDPDYVLTLDWPARDPAAWPTQAAYIANCVNEAKALANADPRAAGAAATARIAAVEGQTF